MHFREPKLFYFDSGIIEISAQLRIIQPGAIFWTNDYNNMG